ncbi:DNA-binding response regulator [bacterium (Candidatus Blackallbacteria) CG17_big_fil_post_rev_8_21_14_2_50_48_46]|uniref:DNA-binding response regulator n=1 Tax=bacterium (Candidatus Blackallbacteria) CG17_big_fil_post_rev_8_21_14_2_50_48_46 TaxID=2014261 RepID=A0A2M7G5P6_9BACT|nr:MAG: DNA-binding response regulator [bacterium (Candidatus Blackallbacteria) CG18_big_fil_WC_8_21_14_2_50_49_26]PIW16903.1 MAG: DNA-binding response regulator [bacterium (Candidatus Blackallbacteria) CG17_big_fil_post_rev_8_21_14_2_50_48_46]PIW49321.1 MAG: DNA-binding response regulator [bacterium (Candidatus Blackallbacteria) CG13_big_fil_rev_8_21_14_2_50_49_14]
MKNKIVSTLQNTIRKADSTDRTRVLILEDDEISAALIARVLQNESVEVQWITDSESCFMAIDIFKPHILISDILLDESSLNGIEVCQRVKTISPQILVMLISGISDTFEIVSGLEAGAEDYIVKPIEPAQLRARFRVLLRRLAQDNNSSDQAMVSGKFSLNFQKRKVFWAGVEIDMRRREFDLLAYLVKHSGRVITRDELLEFVWSDPQVGGRTVDTHIQRLRRKLNKITEGEELIETSRGIGYFFKGQVEIH